MANTYHKMYIQTVFVVKYRKAIISPEWDEKLHSVIGNLVNESGCKSILVNGVYDHIHCFFHTKPALSVSEVMKIVKAKSSKWINDNNLLAHRFEWQRGFGCFTYGHSQKNDVYRYVANQTERHKKMSFREEYIKLLRSFDVDYNERYIFRDLE